MSYDDYGPFIPLIMLVTFVGLFIWVLHPKNKAKYDEAANMPLCEPDEPASDINETHNRGEEK